MVKVDISFGKLGNEEVVGVGEGWLRVEEGEVAAIETVVERGMWRRKR